MDTNTIIPLAFSVAAAALAGTAKAVRDKVTHHFTRSIFALLPNPNFWDASRSWKRKYRNYDAGDTRPRFPLSTTLLVAFTDAWHLFDNLSYLLVIIASVTASVAVALQSHEAGTLLWSRAALVGLLQFAALVAAFHISYHHLFHKSQN